MRKDILVGKLKPYWHKYRKLKGDFNVKLLKLEKKMNKKVDINTEVEFFFVDGEVVGIGARNYHEREIFPLIHDTDLDNYEG